MIDIKTDDFAALPRRHYGTIAADPAWQFSSWTDERKSRAANVRQKGLSERHYAVMPMHEIRRLPVGELAAKRSALFLWAVDCMLPQAIEIGEGWGFRFKTIAFTWIKTNRTKPGYCIGLGHWTRGNPESCLLFTRGSPRRQSASVRQLIVSHRREHSRKPPEVLERIEALLPGPRLEMFCREPRPGWDSWGNQVGRFDLPLSQVAAE